MTPEEAVKAEVARQDADRTGIEATMIPWTEPPLELINGRWYGPRGAFIEASPKTSESQWILCCPACRQLGGPREGAKWTIEAGSFDDVSKLTLSPSILKNCCGWHGYLRNGVFKA